jgi:hypothetical protein
MRMTEALRQVAENVQEMKKDRTGNPTTMKDAEKEAVKKVDLFPKSNQHRECHIAIGKKQPRLVQD